METEDKLVEMSEQMCLAYLRSRYYVCVRTDPQKLLLKGSDVLTPAVMKEHIDAWYLMEKNGLTRIGVPPSTWVITRREPHGADVYWSAYSAVGWTTQLDQATKFNDHRGAEEYRRGMNNRDWMDTARVIKAATVGAESEPEKTAEAEIEPEKTEPAIQMQRVTCYLLEREFGGNKCWYSKDYYLPGSPLIWTGDEDFALKFDTASDAESFRQKSRYCDELAETYVVRRVIERSVPVAGDSDCSNGWVLQDSRGWGWLVGHEFCAPADNPHATYCRDEALWFSSKAEAEKFREQFDHQCSCLRSCEAVRYRDIDPDATVEEAKYLASGPGCEEFWVLEREIPHGLIRYGDKPDGTKAWDFLLKRAMRFKTESDAEVYRRNAGKRDYLDEAKPVRYLFASSKTADAAAPAVPKGIWMKKITPPPAEPEEGWIIRIFPDGAIRPTRHNRFVRYVHKDWNLGTKSIWTNDINLAASFATKQEAEEFKKAHSRDTDPTFRWAPIVSKQDEYNRIEAEKTAYSPLEERVETATDKPENVVWVIRRSDHEKRVAGLDVDSHQYLHAEWDGSPLVRWTEELLAAMTFPTQNDARDYKRRYGEATARAGDKSLYSASVVVLYRGEEPEEDPNPSDTWMTKPPHHLVLEKYLTDKSVDFNRIKPEPMDSGDAMVLGEKICQWLTAGGKYSNGNTIFRAMQSDSLADTAKIDEIDTVYAATRRSLRECEDLLEGTLANFGKRFKDASSEVERLRSEVELRISRRAYEVAVRAGHPDELKIRSGLDGPLRDNDLLSDMTKLLTETTAAKQALQQAIAEKL